MSENNKSEIIKKSSNPIEYLNTNEQLVKYENIIIQFTAEWCGPCKKIEPKIVNLSEESKYNHIKFFKADVDDQKLDHDIISKYEISCVPTFIFLKNNEHVETTQGADFDNLHNKILAHYPIPEKLEPIVPLLNGSEESSVCSFKSNEVNKS